jgi:hypothetical protein
MTLHTQARGFSLALRDLHRLLLESVRRQYESLYARVDNPYELFRLTREDPLFSWLKPLTRALTELDEAIDASPEDAARVKSAIRNVEALLNGRVDAQSDADTKELAMLYRPHLQNEPEVTFAHGRVRTSLRELDRPAPTAA